MNISTSTDLKRRVKMLPFHYVSSARKSNLLEPSGGGSGGGGGGEGGGRVNKFKV